ncbi:MAG: DNA-processing protein DprA [Planctomycetota bacterium]|jgi:DNA processing protein
MTPKLDDPSRIHTLLLLNSVPGFGPSRTRALSESLGSLDAAWTATAAQLSAVPGIGPGLSRALIGAREVFDPRVEIERARRLSIEILTEKSSGYPPLLREIYAPPPLLYARGDLGKLQSGTVAVVGTRRCTHYGRMQAEKLAGALSGAGIVVVSGLARGIDTAAHRAALEAGGCTVAVLGSGLDRPYPPENAKLMAEISINGVLLSEFPLGTAPLRSNFPRRNRIISGMSLGVVVVEASLKSGSLITARCAAEQGREVFAVPGKIDSTRSTGTHALIKDGAKLIENVGDILEEISHLVDVAPRKQIPDRSTSFQEDETDPVLAALGFDPLGIEEIIEKTGLEPGEVAGRLFRLELRRLVRQFPGKQFSKNTGS